MLGGVRLVFYNLYMTQARGKTFMNVWENKKLVNSVLLFAQTLTLEGKKRNKKVCTRSFFVTLFYKAVCVCERVFQEE